MTHLVGAAVARGLAEVPDLNARVVLGAVRPRASVDVSFALATDGGAHLSAACVRNADRKAPHEIGRELFAAARLARDGSDGAFGRSIRVADALPRPLVRPGLALAGFLAAGLGVGVRPLRLRPHPFGGALVSSVGMLGIERGLAPLLPFARVGLVVVIGEIAWRPRVVEGAVVPRRVVEVGVTLDHRLVDGTQIARFTETLRAAVEQPATAWPEPAAGIAR